MTKINKGDTEINPPCLRSTNFADLQIRWPTLLTSYLSLPLVQVSDGVDQGVGSQDDAGALRPLGAHQRVLAQQDLADIFCARHPDDGLPQQVGLEHVSMALSARDVEVWTLWCEEEENIWILYWIILISLQRPITWFWSTVSRTSEKLVNSNQTFLERILFGPRKNLGKRFFFCFVCFNSAFGGNPGFLHFVFVGRAGWHMNSCVQETPLWQQTRSGDAHRCNTPPSWAPCVTGAQGIS